MPTRNARPTIFRAKTLSDAVDSTNGPQGAMQILQNLVPAPFNRDIMVPRPAALQITSFASFISPTAVELQFVVGHRVYGYIASGRFSGLSEPFIYDYVANSFITLTGVTAAKCPVSASTTGDWSPPSAAQVGGRVMTTHPGFTGAAGVVMGWFDMTGLVVNTITGNTHATTLIDTLSTNPLLAGVAPGMLISDSAGDIPAGAYVVSATITSITISVPTTGANVGTTLTITGGTFAAPLWCGGNTNGRTIVIPNAVENFNGRAYYGTGPQTDFSDAGNAVQISDNPIVQTINFQNGVNVTALAGTPYTNVLGGITQSLIVFQGVSAIQQITGDPTTNNLLSQALITGTGTAAPNSLDNIPNIGLAFIAPDGLRFVGLNGVVSTAVGSNGDGVSLPFLNAQFPSRMAGAWANDTYRVAVKTAVTPAMIWGQSTWGQALWGTGQIVTQEYWFNTKLNIWTGPHTFPSTLISANQTTGGFIVSSLSAGTGLWTSDAIPTNSESYTELGQVLSCNALTSLLPDNQLMSMNSLGAQGTAIGFASSGGFTATVTFIRENGQQLDSVQIPVSGQSEAIWGQFNWGAALWGAPNSKFAQYQIPWHQPLVFKQGMIGVSFAAGPGNLMGNFYLRIEPLGYLILGESDAA